MKTAYRQKMEAQLMQWDEQLIEWTAKAETATAATRSNYHNDLESLRGKRDRAQRLLLGMHIRSGNRWEDLRDVFEHTWLEIDDAFEKASLRFR